MPWCPCPFTTEAYIQACVYQEFQGDSAGRFSMLSSAFNMFLFSSLASRSPMSTLGVGALGTVAYGYKTAVKAIDLYLDLTIDSDMLSSLEAEFEWNTDTFCPAEDYFTGEMHEFCAAQ